ncbi:ABC transporter permease [Nonomuraea sp. NPDC052265]|uniref:ABC transporter permease n=1 Tax=Nonomuraea sp. NPDC052265 TaxID=3364374 RepID=UPI0037C50246
MSVQPLTFPDPLPLRSRNPFRIIAAELKYGFVTLPRSPVAMVVTLLLPLAFNLLFNLINRERVVGGVTNVQFTTAAVVVFVIFTSGYFMNAVSIVVARESGILRRISLTPIPRPIYLSARVLFSTLTGAISTAIMILVSIVAFGLQLGPSNIIVLLIAFLLGSYACAVLGMAIARFIPTAEAAVGVAMATMLPLMFASGVFFPIDGMPEIVRGALGLLPVQPMAETVRLAFHTSTVDLLSLGPELGVLTAWAVLGTTLVAKTMRWEPRR